MKSKVDVDQILETHRYFAIECNNKAWSLAEAKDANDHREELLNLAHAAAFHWQAIGNDLQKMRATMLLANVHALLGLSQSAMSYAEQMRRFFLAQPSVADWEIAFVHTIYARACACSGDATGHAESFDKALAAIEAIVDPEDKAIVLTSFEQIPRPDSNI